MQLSVDERRVSGEVAIKIPAGSARATRDKLIAEAVTPLLDEVARSEGVVVTAVAERYVRERPGRDADGRTVFDVSGFIDGDYLVPHRREHADGSRRRR